jgi:Mad3/BUB1 homology region 1
MPTQIQTNTARRAHTIQRSIIVPNPFMSEAKADGRTAAAFSSSVAAAPLWEQVKENAAPLERGRNVARLEQAFRPSLVTTSGSSEAAIDSLSSQVLAGDQKQDSRTLEKARFEQLVQASEQSAPNLHLEEEEDPLIHWLSYLQFQQESFPSDTRGRFLLLERCVRTWCQTPRYANDERFVRVCALYAADNADAAHEIFVHLHAAGVGRRVTIFYAAWAWVAETAQQFERADEILQRGLAEQAQPLVTLQQRHQQFQRRWSRHWLRMGQQQQEEEEDLPSARRGALRFLSRDALQTNDRALETFRDRSAPLARPSLPQQRPGSTSIFPIFQEDPNAPAPTLFSDENQRTLPPVLPRQADRKKENTARAQTWTTATHGPPRMVTSTVAAPPAFSVHVDETCRAQQQAQERDRQRSREQQGRFRDERQPLLRERSTATTTDAATTVEERLRQDPLRYLRNPQQLAVDQETAARQAEPAAKPAKGSGKSVESKAIGRNFRSQVPPPDESGAEQCFDEVRAQKRWFRLTNSSANINLFHQPQADEDDDDDDDMSVSEDSAESDEGVACEPAVVVAVAHTSRLPLPRVPRHPSVTQATMEDVEGSFTAASTSQNTSTASSTVDDMAVPVRRDEQTINTQLALKELSMMFASPAGALMSHISEDEESQDASLVRMAGTLDVSAEASTSGINLFSAPRSMPRRDHGSLQRKPSLPFSIHQDVIQSNAPSNSAPANSFSIYCDEMDPPPGHHDGDDEVGDTATFSQLGEVARALRPASRSTARTSTSRYSLESRVDDLTMDLTGLRMASQPGTYT